MEVRILKAAQWHSARKKLLAFARRYGDSRLSAGGIRALSELEPSNLERDGSSSFDSTTAADNTSAVIAVALHDGILAGFAFSLGGGEHACLVVVRPHSRGLGVGSELLRALQSHCVRLTCTVATDNPASMGMCFRAGMKAVGMEQGPTGKPTLRFQSGEESCPLT
ncbi:GNAT family N-acetyltransferase [Paenibacillus oenotherae]|uniref:GNAT family N-acetyltransferase n=1 Tax=Paenibacillus oenotherae TaxID=1435645 RepID=A0ABS7DAX6_9BACL|nr:GNAT family N-acetyltransferase [Paenibacillus oenotherae]MBW7477046.1 GNAT family N-acetyltransferase [Paenibacillus oenotherae]